MSFALVQSCGLVTLLLFAVVSSLSPGDIGNATTPPSGCNVCASSGDCSHAFHDGPGQFCGVWMAVPCCCPMNAICNVSPVDSVCTCAYVGTMPPHHSDSDLMNKVLWMWWALGVLVVLAFCGGCSYFVVKRMANNSDERCTFLPPEIVVPVISPTREALYGSTGRTASVTFAAKEEREAEGGGAGTGAAHASAAFGVLNLVEQASHVPAADDLGVAGDGFDGGLGSLEKVEEAQDEEEDESVEGGEADEEIALLTVPGKK
ncbi:unnamed protein product [Phytophthora lilii]|uniref:Unnamed protein product n=1 Tax=Phytophthora lilii TaxID=2077276 RepID=A0A9W6U1Y1_9STRA|nr:unnamed protein product [Phytophthora lilii]